MKKHCNLVETYYRDYEMMNKIWKKHFESKKEGIEFLKEFRNNMKKHVYEEFGEEVLDYIIVKSNKTEFIYILRCTDYGTGYIDFKYEYKIV